MFLSQCVVIAALEAKKALKGICCMRDLVIKITITSYVPVVSRMANEMHRKEQFLRFLLGPFLRKRREKA